MSRERGVRNWRTLAETASVLFVLAVVPSACAPEGDAPAQPVPAVESETALAAVVEPPRVVLLISIDALRPDHLGAYGYERFTSPVIDSLAREGVLFEDANAAAPWTLPSHASILTGLYPARHRVTTTKSRLPAEIPTLAALLSAAGYRSAAVVNVAWLKRESFQLTREFDDYVWVETSLGRRTANSFVTDQAIDWLTALEEGQRLFLFAHWYDVHSDYASDESYERLFVRPYDGEIDGTAWQLKQASLSEEYLEFCRTEFDPEVCKFGDHFQVNADTERITLQPEDIAHLQDLYDAQIRQTDTELGRLFAAMRRKGLFDDSLIIVTSDHGQEFHEHGSVEHFITTYQEVLRVPLVMRGPELPAGLRVAMPVSSVDLLPTVAALTGAELPPGIDGFDLSPLWSDGDEAPFRERLIFGEASGGAEYNERMEHDFFPTFHSARRGNHKVVFDSDSGAYRLYDLDADPLESRDLSAELPELLAELTTVLQLRHASEEEAADDQAEISDEDLERLRALGYIP